MKEKEWKKWIFWFTFALATIVVYKTIDSVSVIFVSIKNLFKILMPFVMATMIAYILYIPCKSVERTYKDTKSKVISKYAKGLSIVTVYLILILLIFIIVNFVIPTISSSLTELAESLPNYYNSAIEFFENVPEDSIWVKLSIAELILNVQEFNFATQLAGWLNLENVNQYIKGIVGVAGFIFDLFVTIVVSIYMLLERHDIKSFINKLSKAILNKKTYGKLSKRGNKINSIFSNYLSGQIIDAVIIGVLVTLIMSIMKIKYGNILGLLIGIFNIIPYFGAIAAISITFIITIFTGGLVKALWLAILVIALHQIQSNIINPIIIKNSVRLNPILVIFAVVVGGAYWGLLGMFLGVPMVAVINELIDSLITEQTEKKNEVNSK